MEAFENITSSALNRGMICPSSLTRKVKANTKDTEIQDRASKIGSEVHSYLELVCNWELSSNGNLCDKLEALLNSEIEESSRLRIAGIDTSKLPRGRTEVAVKYNPRTCYGKEIKLKEKRNYEIDSNFIFGTCDLVYESKDGKELNILDWKTGTDEYASDSVQLRFFAVAFNAIYRNIFKRIITKIGMVRHDGAIEYSEKIYEKKDLEIAENEFASLYSAVLKEREAKDSKGNQSFVPGSHCYYCPNLNQCSIGSGQVSKDRYMGMSLGEKWDWLGVQRQWIESEIDRLKGLATEAPIALPNGKELTGSYQERIYLNEKKTFSTLEKLLGREEAEKLGEFKVTLKDLQVRFGNETQEVIKQLNDLGCIERRSQFVVRARKAVK